MWLECAFHPADEIAPGTHAIPDIGAPWIDSGHVGEICSARILGRRGSASVALRICSRVWLKYVIRTKRLPVPSRGELEGHRPGRRRLSSRPPLNVGYPEHAADIRQISVVADVDDEPRVIGHRPSGPDFSPRTQRLGLEYQRGTLTLGEIRRALEG